MSKIQNASWIKPAIAILLFLAIGVFGILQAQDKPAPSPLTLSGPRIVYVSTTADYSVTVLNSGQEAQADTRLVVQLPAAFSYVSSEPNGVIVPAQKERPATVTWQLEKVEPGKQIEVKLKVRATKTGTASINAECLASGQAKPIKASTRTMIIGVPAMHMAGFDTEDPVAVGGETAYVLEIRSEGTSPCTNVGIEYEIPEQMEFVSAEASVEYELEGNILIFAPQPILSPGQKATYRITCKVIAAGGAKHKAVLTYDQFDGPITQEEGTSCFQ